MTSERLPAAGPIPNCFDPPSDLMDASSPPCDDSRSDRKRAQAAARMRKHRDRRRRGELQVAVLIGPELLDQLILLGGLSQNQAVEPSVIARVVQGLLCAAAADQLQPQKKR